jgi:hypothetical protein
MSANEDKEFRKAMDNVTCDRALALSLLTELRGHLTDMSSYEKLGDLSVKYLDVMIKANEQHVKLTSLLYKRRGGNLTDEEREELFDALDEMEADATEEKK